jgi:hypothetical protein
LKEKALDYTMWRNRFGRGFGTVVRQNTEWMNKNKVKIDKIEAKCFRTISDIYHKPATLAKASAVLSLLQNDGWTKYQFGRRNMGDQFLFLGYGSGNIWGVFLSPPLNFCWRLYCHVYRRNAETMEMTGGNFAAVHFPRPMYPRTRFFHGWTVPRACNI